MKIHLLRFFILGFALLPYIGQGQVTINNSIFPAPGDTLSTVTTFDFSGFDKNEVGADIMWDLSNSSGGFLTEVIYADPSEGEASDLFPDADLLDNSTMQEIYYQTFNNKVVEIGRSGLDPVLNLIDLTFENDGESILRRAPMSFGDVYSNESSFFIASDASVVPDSILGELASSVDSLRLLVETSNDDEVDAWGMVTLPDGSHYEVLRVKRTTTTNVVLGAKVVFLGWVNVDPNNPLFGILGDLLNLIGESTTVSYSFFANDNKEIIATYSEDTDGNLVSMTYKGSMTTSVEKVDLKEENLLTYPNPTYGDVTFQLVNMPHDDYQVVVHNILGKKMWSSDIDYFQGRLRADLSFLRKGTYFYSILNGAGQKVTTRRLMIMTP
ncbi:MAG: T9SS type A sorting domain-containing protein [Saprospiraceae bacterium]|nr:T9SS type A sorting domain-containing protein [Saprospiraceae bacterium]